MFRLSRALEASTCTLGDYSFTVTERDPEISGRRLNGASRSIRGRYPRAPNMTDRTRTAKGTSTHPSDGWRTASVSIRLAGVARIRRVPVMELEAAEEAERVERLERKQAAQGAGKEAERTEQRKVRTKPKPLTGAQKQARKQAKEAQAKARKTRQAAIRGLNAPSTSVRSIPTAFESNRQRH